MQAIRSIYGAKTEAILPRASKFIVIYEKNPLGLRSKPPPKDKKLKIQNLIIPQEAEAHAAGPEAGRVVVPLRRPTFPRR